VNTKSGPEPGVKETDYLHSLLEDIEGLIGDAVNKRTDLGHCTLSAIVDKRDESIQQSLFQLHLQ
jgi:hypothetical protein